ncbi:MAG TPA: hypothetical protein EYP16_00555 [Candidatus Atribacteria bacterium]|nr:hypothetical protein [Candidatus Atribacteria bacterium]
MKNNMEEEMGAFEEHALSEEDAKEAIDATEQKTQLISMIHDTETKFKYLLSLGGKDQEKVNELLVLEFIKLSLSIGEDIDQLKNEIEENSVLDQEERNLVFAAVTGLSPDDAMRYMDMTIEELEVILKTLYDELKNNTEEMA